MVGHMPSSPRETRTIRVISHFLIKILQCINENIKNFA
jgi:hypothetical protein